HRRYQDEAHDKRVYQNGEAEAETEHLDHAHIFEYEAEEYRSHDRASSRNHLATVANAIQHGFLRLGSVHLLLVNAAQQEYFVIQTQAEEHTKENHWQEGLNRPRSRNTEQVSQPAPLEHGHDGTERGTDREQCREGCLDRDEDRLEHHHQQQDAESDHNGVE